jgi:hypothetical protein
MATIPATRTAGRPRRPHGIGIMLLVGACAGQSGREDATAPFVRSVLEHESFSWESRTTDRFALHAVAGSWAAEHLDSLGAVAHAARRDVLTRLGEGDQPNEDPTHLFLLRGREDFARLVGQPAGGWTEPEANAILLTAVADGGSPFRHELGHLYSHRRWGAPAGAWLSEGVAVFAVGHCAGLPLHAWAAGAERQGLLRPLAELEAGFDYARAAPHLQAGSFVEFVAERFGMPALRELWRGGLAAAAPATALDAGALERAWLRTIHGQDTGVPVPDLTGRVSCEGVDARPS